MMDAPVFLIGAECSGTALLRLMLDDHPEVSWPCEFDFALDWPAAKPGEWPDLIGYWGTLAESRQARESRVVIRANLDFPHLVRSLLDQLSARTRKLICGVTAHRHFGRILTLWPDARFIYLVRDGRDVARSRVEMGRAGNVWAGASEWRKTERDWRRLCECVPAERRAEVRYEDLIRCPQRELTRICDFLGVAYSSEMLAYLSRTPHSAPDAGAVEGWRERLSERELAWLECEIGADLRVRAYAPSRVPPAWIPAPRRLALHFGDRLGRARFFMQRYSARLSAKHRVARRFRLAALYRITAQRIQAIDAAHLR